MSAVAKGESAVKIFLLGVVECDMEAGECGDLAAYHKRPYLDARIIQ